MINDVINKIVGFVANPLFVGMLLVTVGLGFVFRKKTRPASWMLCMALAWFWLWSMPVVGRWMCLPLEEDYPVQLAEDMPEADAIVLMGGGVWGDEHYPYACLNESADRAWHAARLWKAGKAPIIIPSNVGAELGDIKLLVDLGVPREAVVLENKAVNTEENAKFVREIIKSRGVVSGGAEVLESTHSKHTHSPTRILLVTSACHMKRSLYMFKKYAPEIECIPAATDYQALPWRDMPLGIRSFLPYINTFANNNAYVHEYIGYYGYRWFR